MKRVSFVLSAVALTCLGNLTAQSAPVAPPPKPDVAGFKRVADELRRAGDVALAEQVMQAARAIAREERAAAGTKALDGLPVGAYPVPHFVANPSRKGEPRAVEVRALQAAPTPSAPTPGQAPRTPRPPASPFALRAPAPQPPAPPPVASPGGDGVVHHYHEVHHYFHGAPPVAVTQGVGDAPAPRASGRGPAPSLDATPPGPTPPRARASRSTGQGLGGTSRAFGGIARGQVLPPVAPSPVGRVAVPAQIDAPATLDVPAAPPRATRARASAPGESAGPQPPLRVRSVRTVTPPAGDATDGRRAMSFGAARALPPSNPRGSSARPGVAAPPAAAAPKATPKPTQPPAPGAAKALEDDVDGLRREVEELRALMQKLREQLKSKSSN